jgi:urease accessory protein
MNAQLHIQVVESNWCTHLSHSYFTTPFKLANITENKTGHTLHLMLQSASPGILDGDEYKIDIEVCNNASLHLHTQAYQRLFNMKKGATQQMTVNVGEAASFVYLPHPSVPHQQSIFTCLNDFYLGHNCHFVFGEVLTSGRKLNGESFLFSKYHSISQVFVDEKLVIKENLLMQPSLIDVNAMGQLEGFTHQASMIVINRSIEIKGLQQQLIEMLLMEEQIEYGVTAAPVNGLIIRLLGHGAEKLQKLLQRINIIISLHLEKIKTQSITET